MLLTYTVVHPYTRIDLSDGQQLVEPAEYPLTLGVSDRLLASTDLAARTYRRKNTEFREELMVGDALSGNLLPKARSVGQPVPPAGGLGLFQRPLLLDDLFCEAFECFRSQLLATLSFVTLEGAPSSKSLSGVHVKLYLVWLMVTVGSSLATQPAAHLSLGAFTGSRGEL